MPVPGIGTGLLHGGSVKMHAWRKMNVPILEARVGVPAFARLDVSRRKNEMSVHHVDLDGLVATRE